VRPSGLSTASCRLGRGLAGHRSPQHSADVAVERHLHAQQLSCWNLAGTQQTSLIVHSAVHGVVHWPARTLAYPATQRCTGTVLTVRLANSATLRLYGRPALLHYCMQCSDTEARICNALLHTQHTTHALHGSQPANLSRQRAQQGTLSRLQRWRLALYPYPLSVPQAVPCQHRTVRGRKSAAVRLLTRKPTAAPLLAPGHNTFQ